MKISPVSGMSTNSSNTGMSAEKLIRATAIAAGQTPPQGHTEGTEAANRPAFPAQRTIKMRTQYRQYMDPVDDLYSADRELDSIATRDTATPSLQNKNISVAAPETAIPDDNVQANVTAEATQPLSPQLAALAKQKRALQVKEREVAEREKALGGSTRAELEARIKSQPLSVLQELGVTYDQLTTDILAAQSGVSPEIHALKAELKALKEGVDKTLSDKDAATEKAVLGEMRRNVNQLCQEGDDFEMIRETRSQPEVMDLIYKTWKRDGEILDEVEAMKLIEEDLVNESLKIARLKKVQGKLTPQPQLQQQPEMRTLTNKDSASLAMSRRQRAILAAQGNLKR